MPSRDFLKTTGLAVAVLAAFLSLMVLTVWFEGDDWVPDYLSAQGIHASDLSH